VLLTAHGPVVMAPAMHTEMWLHAATQANVATLRSRGVVVVDPDSGRLTGPDSGPGRLPDPSELAAVVASVLADPDVSRRAAGQDLAGLHVVVSAGGTREHLDPVRFLGNASSGRMGWSLARAARLRGATVTLVAANVDLAAPPGVSLVPVTSTADLAAAVSAAAGTADLVVMAAAPADFTPGAASDTKIKKSGDGGLALDLVQTPDVLAGLVRDRSDPRQVLVGFAAETPGPTCSLVELGRAKLARKGCDLLVLNAVGVGKVFGQPDSEITLLTPTEVDGPHAGSKDTLAHIIWDAARTLRTAR
jgi:phosphopantothenoylcysteine decarboxylase/phosphopantothenate--cysteine ligase